MATSKNDRSGGLFRNASLRLIRHNLWLARAAARGLRRRAEPYRAERPRLPRPPVGARYQLSADGYRRPGGPALRGRYGRQDQPHSCRVQSARDDELRARDRLDEFEREVVQPLALDELGSRATRIDHLGSYSCRRQNSRTAGRWSQHAQGQANDISGFRLSDGTTVSLARDWNEPGAKGQFLRHLAQRACRYFSVVLTPDSNAEHYDHMHLDIGPERLCSA